MSDPYEVLKDKYMQPASGFLFHPQVRSDCEVNSGEIIVSLQNVLNKFLLSLLISFLHIVCINPYINCIY